MYTDIEILYSGADKLLHAKDLIGDWEFIKAKYVIEEVLEDEPLNAEAHYLMAYIFHHHYAEYSTAMKHYEVALRINKNFDEAINGLMMLYNKCELVHQAIQIGKKALHRVSAYRTSIQFELANAYEKSGNLDEGKRILTELSFSATDEGVIEDVTTALERIERKLERLNDNMSYVSSSWAILSVNSA